MNTPDGKNVCQICPEGELTIFTAAENKVSLMAMVAQCHDLEIDLSRVSEMDTAGLQLLILAKRECAARNGSLRLVHHSAPVLEVLNLCNMIPFFGDPVLIQSQAR